MELNNELRLSVPEGFHVMDEEEKSRLRLLEEGPFVGLSDPERHILVTVGWKQLGGLLSALVSSGDVAKSMEKNVSRAMAQLGYRRTGFTKTQVAGAEAGGFRYEYRAQDVDMAAESVAVKIKKTVYYFHFYGRAAGKEENAVCRDAILSSVQRIKPSAG